MAKRKDRDYKYEMMTCAPSKIGHAVVYLRGPDGEGPVHVFGEVWVARRFCDEVLCGSEGKWEEDKDGRFWLKNEAGWCLGGDMIEEVMEHEYCGEEESYSIDWDNGNAYRGLRKYQGQVVIPVGTVRAPSLSKKKERAVNRVQKRIKKEVLDGYVTLIAICEGIGLKPSKGRQIMRNAMESPKDGWVFKEEDIEKIEGILKDGV